MCCTSAPHNQQDVGKVLKIDKEKKNNTASTLGAYNALLEQIISYINGKKEFHFLFCLEITVDGEFLYLILVWFSS